MNLSNIWGEEEQTHLTDDALGQEIGCVTEFEHIDQVDRDDRSHHDKSHAIDRVTALKGCKLLVFLEQLQSAVDGIGKDITKLGLYPHLGADRFLDLDQSQKHTADKTTDTCQHQNQAIHILLTIEQSAGKKGESDRDQHAQTDGIAIDLGTVSGIDILLINAILGGDKQGIEAKHDTQEHQIFVHRGQPNRINQGEPAKDANYYEIAGFVARLFE